MRRQEKGFTLIELVVVLVILGILAAVAVPQFYNATADAESAAVNGARAAVGSAIAIASARNKNFATVASVATELSAVCSTTGVLQLTGTGTRGVRITVFTAPSATTATACTSSAIGIAAASYTAL